MSIETHQLLMFIAAGWLLNLTPGPDVLYIVSNALRSGTRAGIVAGLGITAGCFVHIFAAAVGVGALLAASATAFTVLKWLGAAYLLWMYQRTMFQKANEKWLSLKDLSAREIITLVPLVGLAIWIGLYPHTFLNLLHAPAQDIISQVQPYLAEHGGSLAGLASAFFGGF